MQDLGLEHLWVIYPGGETYPLTDRITVLPITAAPTLVGKLQRGEFRS
jgi:hypothetical protein